MKFKFAQELLKPFAWSKKLGKNHAVEASGWTKNTHPVYQAGFHILSHEGHFRSKWSILILSVEVDFNWKGDHPGFFLTIDTPWRELIDFEYYDIRHEEQIAEDNAR